MQAAAHAERERRNAAGEAGVTLVGGDPAEGESGGGEGEPFSNSAFTAALAAAAASTVGEDPIARLRNLLPMLPRLR